MSHDLTRVAILGASGYAGGELVRLVDQHPLMELVHIGAHSKAGQTLGSVHPNLGGGDRILGTLAPSEVPDVDVVFLALPHGASAAPAMALSERTVMLVDLGSDFRISDPARYAAAYGSQHPAPEQLGNWVYGLAELNRRNLVGAQRIAVPGCYPTSALLALGPLVTEGGIDTAGIIVDALSGVSGAGRSVKAELQFGAMSDSAHAYNLIHHRHRPEIEQGIEMVGGVDPIVTFTPHLVPMHRGILSTAYARTGLTEGELHTILLDAYTDAPFVNVIEEPPATRWVVRSNNALIAVKVDERAGCAVIVSAIDNLLKGAAGQAVQCVNIALGWDETTGLPMTGAMP